MGELNPGRSRRNPATEPGGETHWHMLNGRMRRFGLPIWLAALMLATIAVIGLVPSQAQAARAWCELPAGTPSVTPARPAAKACWTTQEAVAGSSVSAVGWVPTARGVVRLDRWTGSVWAGVTTARVSSDARFNLTFRTSSLGVARYRVVHVPGDGTFSVLALPSLRVVRLVTYSVVTRGRIVADVGHFTGFAADTFADPRGWAGTNRRFVRVPSGGDFTLVLSEARYLPTYSSVCSVQYSCRVGRYVIINQDRWRFGSRPYPGSLTSYRQMVINHETGHWLGRGHVSCPGAGRPAPVMQQQSKGMQGCRPNPWPLAWELAGASTSATRSADSRVSQTTDHVDVE